ncbi:MAG: GNAT family protein [Anaerolineales bacterium]
MMMKLFEGELVRFSSEDPEVVAKATTHWTRDGEYLLLMDDEPAMMWSLEKNKEWLEKEQGKSGTTQFTFPLRTLHDDLLIGFVGLFGIKWNHGEAWLGVGLGDRAYWGKGYGTDAIRLALRYAFNELNLHRVSLDVFEYNQRAIRSYEKSGFTVEGRSRGEILRQGRRWDVITMGILRQEWQQLQED